MADQATQIFPVGPTLLERRLIPALKGCVKCGTTQMIASPELGVCAECGDELTVLSRSEL